MATKKRKIDYTLPIKWRSSNTKCLAELTHSNYSEHGTVRK